LLAEQRREREVAEQKDRSPNASDMKNRTAAPKTRGYRWPRKT
jgi:hypothetical protein